MDVAKTSTDKSADELIEKLAKAVSTQAESANRIWLGLVTVSIVGLLPQAPTNLPFGLGSVEPSSFRLIVFLMIVVFAIAFSSAHAQHIRAQKLVHEFIDTLPAHGTGTFGMHPRELFDMLRLPSLNRVAPLAQLLRGQYQFYRKPAPCPRWRKVVTTFYYILLRLISMIVYFGLPAFSLYHSHNLVKAVGFLSLLIFIGGVFAAFTLLQMVVSELAYLRKNVPAIWSGGESSVGK